MMRLRAVITETQQIRNTQSLRRYLSLTQLVSSIGFIRNDLRAADASKPHTHRLGVSITDVRR